MPTSSPGCLRHPCRMTSRTRILSNYFNPAPCLQGIYCNYRNSQPQPPTTLIVESFDNDAPGLTSLPPTVDNQKPPGQLWPATHHRTPPPRRPYESQVTFLVCVASNHSFCSWSLRTRGAAVAPHQKARKQNNGGGLTIGDAERRGAHQRRDDTALWHSLMPFVLSPWARVFLIFRFFVFVFDLTKSQTNTSRAHSF